MVALPPLFPAARPLTLIEATAVPKRSTEVQAAVLVRSCRLLSENPPTRLNCCVVPLAMFGALGESPAETSVALVTVRKEAPETAPKAAWMTEAPAFLVVANPEAEIDATLVPA